MVWPAVRAFFPQVRLISELATMRQAQAPVSKDALTQLLDGVDLYYPPSVKRVVLGSIQDSLTNGDIRLDPQAQQDFQGRLTDFAAFKNESVQRQQTRDQIAYMVDLFTMDQGLSATMLRMLGREQDRVKRKMAEQTDCQDPAARARLAEEHRKLLEGQQAMSQSMSSVMDSFHAVAENSIRGMRPSA